MFSPSPVSSLPASPKRTASEIYGDIIQQFEISNYLEKSKEEFLYYFFVQLNHQNVSATRVLCLLNHRRKECLLHCRDRAPTYRRVFHIHLGNLRKHFFSCHKV